MSHGTKQSAYQNVILSLVFFFFIYKNGGQMEDVRLL